MKQFLKEMAGKTMDRKFRSKSIAFKLTSICGIIGTAKRAPGVLYGGGELWNRQEANQYRIFAEKVKGCRNNLKTR